MKVAAPLRFAASLPRAGPAVDRAQSCACAGLGQKSRQAGKDRCDRRGAAAALRPRTPARRDAWPGKEQRELLNLLMLRSAVVEDISAYRHRQALLTPTAQTRLAALIAALAARRLALEHQMAAWLLTASEAWRDRVQTLCLTVRIGVLIALQLLAYLLELGTCNRRQVAKLAGLAPLPWDSGRMHGLRRIRHGRAPARRGLYQCAVVAARWNETLRPYCQQLRAHGKPAKLAHVRSLANCSSTSTPCWPRARPSPPRRLRSSLSLSPEPFAFGPPAG